MSSAKDHPWRNSNKLEEMYHREEMEVSEIAEELGCTRTTIYNWLERHDIEKRDQTYPWIFQREDTGYEVIRHTVDGEEKSVQLHRLVALLDNDISDLVGKHVHHKNGIAWDNRPENLEVLSPSDHRDEHLNLDSNNTPWRDENVLREFAENGLSTVAIGEELGCTCETVRRWMNKFDIETEHTRGKPWHDEDTLRSMYVSGMSTTEIGDELGCSAQTVSDWMKKHKIETRSISEAKLEKNK